MNTPQFLTIRETAKRGPLTEYTLRLLEKQGKLPCIYAGKKCLINYDRYIELLNTVGGSLTQ